MDDPRTTPCPQGQLGVTTVRVEVLEGPDAGTVHLAPTETVSVGSARGNDLVLGDPTVSRFHLELSGRPDGILVVDHSSTNGTLVSGVRIERAVVQAGTVLRAGKTSLRVDEGCPATVRLHEAASFGTFLGVSAPARRLMAQAEQVASSNAAVLILGESGTGKEILAQSIHELSTRASSPFVTVDCGALAPTLVASELLGHERGAFTGADRQRRGALEEAGLGTLFFDEIGELPLALQTMLLGVLERRRFRRLGGREELPLEARLICATNRDLRSEVNTGAFRLDLYYRVAVVPLTIPPLRDCPDDIPVLVEHFARESGYEGPLEALVSPEAMASLRGHRWPGNARELRNLIEATLAMGELPPLGERAAPEDPISDDLLAPLLGRPYKEARRVLLQHFEARYLRRILEVTGGNVARAARDARMDRSYLIQLLKRHGLDGQRP